jgi:serine/threonine protein kinase
MSIGSGTPLIDALKHIPLLDSESLAELPTLAGQFPDPESLAKELMRRGWLTPYQTYLLLQGKGRELVRGAYVILEKLGDAVPPRTFKARHQPTKRTVALKLVPRELLLDPEVSARFYREVQVASQVANVHVAQPLEVFPEGNEHLVAMEYVEGKDFGKLLRGGEPLLAVQACDYVRQIALGLQHIHERGLIHRALKPTNLLLADSPRTPAVVKVLSLGLARALSAEERSGDFTAPEQASDFHGVDIRADIYSLGAVFFYLLTGTAPARDGTPDVKGIQADLSLVLLRMLAYQPYDRFQSPAEVAAALAPLTSTTPAAAIVIAESALASETVEAFVGGSMTHLAAYATPRLAGAPEAKIPAPVAEPWPDSPTTELPQTPKSFARWPLVAGVVLLALAIGALVWLVVATMLPEHGRSVPSAPVTSSAPR